MSDDSNNRPQTLKQCVNEALEEYLSQVEQEHISELYNMVLGEVEAPMLAVVMKHAGSNQSKSCSYAGSQQRHPAQKITPIQFTRLSHTLSLKL